MRYLALACDYDGTLAHDGRVDEPTLAALERLRGLGRKLLLVTGRELDELLRHLPAPRPVRPGRRRERRAALPARRRARRSRWPSRRRRDFVDRLRERGVAPLSVGRVDRRHLGAARDRRARGHPRPRAGAAGDLQQGRRDGAARRASTRRPAWPPRSRELGLSPHNVVGVGDAENDHAFLALCECAAAVANALPAVKERADFVTRGDHGAGVVELIDELIADDLRRPRAPAGAPPPPARHPATTAARCACRPYGANVLIAGPSGSGKSTLATGAPGAADRARLPVLRHRPRGRLRDLRGGGGRWASGTAAPTADEVLELLKRPGQNVVVNLLGLPLADRPRVLPGPAAAAAGAARAHRPAALARGRRGAPPAARVVGAGRPGPARRSWRGLLLITVHPEHVAPAVLATVDAVVAVGEAPETTLGEFCQALAEQPPALAAADARDRARCCSGRGRPGTHRAGCASPRAATERRRHRRKYAEGDLPPDRSFYFRGPEGKLNLRAQNLILFLQLAEGVDDETWLYHLRRGRLLALVPRGDQGRGPRRQGGERRGLAGVSAGDSRGLIAEAIEEHYTLPA